VGGIEFKNPRNIEELREYLEVNIKRVLNIFGWDGSVSVLTGSPMPEFPVIARNFWKMKILDRVYSSPFDAINDIGEEVRKYREDRRNPSAKHTRKTKKGVFSYWVTKDYDAVKSIYTGSPTSVPLGSIFGLPHQFQFQSIGKKAIVRGVKRIGDKEVVYERRASPLQIKIWKLDENEYAIGLQIFLSKFLPDNSKLLISDLRDRAIRTETNLPLYNYLTSFLDSLPGRWIKL
jgi:hypothetical protein